MRNPRTMTRPEIETEIEDLKKKWDARRDDDEGHGGSPGEWIVERLEHLETVLKKGQYSE